MANKYLDDSGLSRMWSKVKTYVSNNYATKSALSDGLAGKANSSHTHTSSQITDLNTQLNKRLTAVTTNATSRTLPSLSLNQLRFFKVTLDVNTALYLPSGGTYGIISNRFDSGNNGVLNGGARIYESVFTSDTIVCGFYIRLS